MIDLRHGQLPAFDPQTDDERLIAENIDAPLSECPYGHSLTTIRRIRVLRLVWGSVDDG